MSCRLAAHLSPKAAFSTFSASNLRVYCRIYVVTSIFSFATDYTTSPEKLQHCHFSGTEKLHCCHFYTKAYRQTIHSVKTFRQHLSNQNMMRQSSDFVILLRHEDKSEKGYPQGGRGAAAFVWIGARSPVRHILLRQEALPLAVPYHQFYR